MAGTGERLLSIDFWRGFALLTIFVNHVPGHFLDRWTYRNFGVSDAAELFVLLAGVSAAFAYLRGFAPGRRLHTVATVLVRACRIYMAHLALVVMAVVVVGGFVVLTGDQRMLEWMHLDIITLYPLESVIGIGLLTYQPAYLNVLPLYVVLLASAPLTLLLASFSLRLALAASFAVYLVAHLAGLGLPIWPGAGDWFFNPLAWQLLFTCGLVIGALIDRGLRSVAHPLLDILAPAYLAAAMVWALLEYPVTLDLAPLPAFLWDFDKMNLTLPRLLHVLALVYCMTRLPVEGWLRSGRGDALILIGRHALPVFCLGTVLSLGAQVTRPLFDGAFACDLVILILGFFLQWALAWALEWQRRGQRPASRETRAPAPAGGR